jgi:hypothetical protein
MLLMKKMFRRNNSAILIVCAALFAASPAARADDQDATNAAAAPQVQSDENAQPSTQVSLSSSVTSPDQHEIVIQTVGPDGKGKHGKEVAWLGLAVEESSEALSSQLGLKPGEGLTVDFLAVSSPAAKADFHKNDVLVDLDGQMLVDPMQFRKLVQMHAVGDEVTLTFYRGGKKRTASVKLGKIDWEAANENDDSASPTDLENLQLQLNGLNGQLRGMAETISRSSLDKVTATLDKARINEDINRTMEQTRKAIRDAMRHASTDQRHLSETDRELEGLAHGGVDVDRDATIIVRNKRNSNKTVLQTDDSGTYIIETGATTHLTARDRHGKLLYDGDIDTPAEREKVPKDVWEKAGPMFDQIGGPSGGTPKSDRDKSGQ